MRPLTNRFILHLLLITIVTIGAIFVTPYPTQTIEINPNVETSKMRPEYPSRWGEPPRIQTRDLVQLPGGYGRGSGTLRNWILQKMAEDEEKSGPKENTSWPELSLVGMNGEDAKNAVIAADSSLQVHIVPEGSIVTMDHRLDRVRIYVNGDSKVVRQPIKG
jgi:hypothetical protein